MEEKCDLKTRKQNPVQNANPIKLVTFLYMIPIFRRAFKEQLTEDDLFEPLKEHKSSIIGDKVERIWKEEFRIHKKTALHRALFRVFGFNFMLLGLCKAFEEISIVIIVPLSISKLVSFFEKGQTNLTVEEAYIYSSIIIGYYFFATFLGHPVMMALQHLSMKLRISCSSLLYRKTLRLSRNSLTKTTIGHLVNLLSNDASKFDQGFILAHFVWIGPIQAGVGMYLLYREIGIAALFGMLFLLSFLPLQVWIGKRTSVLRLKTALKTDERVRLMNEILSGIQVIKMYCWEKPFAKLIALARRKEMKNVKSYMYLVSIICSFEFFVTRTSVFISIIGYVLLGNYIDAEKVFTVTAIYTIIRPVITTIFSFSISSIAAANVTINRFQEVLALEEISDTEQQYKNGLKMLTNGDLKNEQKNEIEKCKLVLSNVCARWSDDAAEDTLTNINLDLSSNQLLAVIGPVGSGKSSLLNVILKELPIQSGTMSIRGKISFAAQEPWLFSASVRQNILFGGKFDEDRYERVVKVCALQSDFSLLPHGDRTLVGEKGKALSGGQKARINLARCIYKEADIYLLDDPLSAVDAAVGKHLYEKCIKGFLKDKICILVTHQLQYLKNANKIIIMKEGNIELEGNYRELQSSSGNFAKLLEEFQSEDQDEQKKIRSRQNSEFEDEKIDEKIPDFGKELQTTGNVTLGTYWAYLKAGGGKLAISILIMFFFACQIAANAGEYYVTYWVNLEQDFSEKIENNQTSPNATFERGTIIYTYSAITLATIILAVVKCIYLISFFANASTNLHDYIFSKIVKATMIFYNQNPSGRILNRFSKDLGTIDEYIPGVILDVAEIALIFLGVIAITAIVNPWLLIPSAILCIIFYLMRCVFIETSRSVKRVEAITRSSIYSHMTASMNGLSTIRAFNAEKVLVEEFDTFQDRHSSAWFLFLGSSRCFGFWLDVCCTIYNAVALFSLLTITNNVYGGDMGLVLTQGMGLLGVLQWGMRQWSEMENQMTSVERILEYTKLDSEPERKQVELPKDWPKLGQIEFRNVNLKYNENDPYVLRDVNFVVQPKEKIGIVGRTGAGKSSTISVLFQLYEMEGSIILDDIDSTKVPLDQVRSKISIIPQEPVLFSGTMRKNLDPFEEYNDDILWNALEQVELKDVISELPCGLNSNVNEGGSNFSVGQRQLVCLARALIRNNKILVMDEATANVDPHTDSLIQQTIREKFADCSVLTIAHRLHTVMDSDKILVMNAGSVEEFDHPHNLLQNKMSLLYNLVKATGTATAKTLENIAKESYDKKKTE